MKRVTVQPDRLPAREDDILDISAALIRRFRTEDPRVPALQANLRILQIEQRQTNPVDAAGGRLANAVVQRQPALRGFNQGEQRPILLASHHPPRRASRMIL